MDKKEIAHMVDHTLLDPCADSEPHQRFVQ